MEDDNTNMAEQKFRLESNENGNVVESTIAAKTNLGLKDPLRPKRKKAKRACSACQRAHLTCGMYFLPTSCQISKTNTD